MKKSILNEIKELCNSFDKTDNMFEKEYIMALFNYLINAYSNDNEIRKMYESITRKMSSSCYDNVIYLLNRNNNINEYLQDNEDFYYENIIKLDSFTGVPNNGIFPLEENNINYILDTFFESLGEEIYLFYKNMSMHERIILNSPTNETSFTSIKNSKTIIFLKQLEDLIDMLILVHEIGHAYYFYLNDVKIAEREDLEVELKDEIPAKIMEMKFINFIRSNALLEQATVLENVYDYVFYKYGMNDNKFTGLKYAIASWVGKNIDSEIGVKEYFKYIYNTNIKKIVLENNQSKKLYK